MPDPVLGSTVATVLAAATAGLLASAAVRNPLLRSRGLSSRSFAAGFGVAYAVVAVALWAVVRAVAHPLSFRGYGDALAGWVALAVLGAAVLGGGTAYVYDRFRYVSALLSLFASTAFTWYAFLLVGGETDVLWVWALLAAPVLVAGAVALFVAEWLLRRLLGRWKYSGDASA